VKQTLKIFLLFILIMLSWSCRAELVINSQIGHGSFEQESPILPVDEAFRFGSYAEGSGIKMFWQVMPGYFLYRDKIEILHDGKAQGIQLPQGVFRQDEIFGKVMVLDGLIELQTTLPPGQELEVRYQGCAAQGFCYPPQKKSLTSPNMVVIPVK
jgi:thiol:disulfide interchange protein DsbD|tara:strand:- start:52 stop:516 length:465 start_codon:yes stop_codon:yes gene_type:complete